MKQAYRFLVIIFAALILQGAGHYFAHELVAGKFFYWGWLVFRVAIPVVLIALLKISWKEMGLNLPRLDRGTKKTLIFTGIILILLFIVMQFMDDYLGAYKYSFMGGAGKYARFINFSIFTLSTLTAWEFFHRSFLFKGLIFTFEHDLKLDSQGAAIIAAAVVAVFEVMFHFKKPMPEAAGLLIASPFLSYLVYKTGSIWPSFLIHLSIEFIFIGSLLIK